jgi:hypothetical protein
MTGVDFTTMTNTTLHTTRAPGNEKLTLPGGSRIKCPDGGRVALPQGTRVTAVETATDFTDGSKHDSPPLTRELPAIKHVNLGPKDSAQLPEGPPVDVTLPTNRVEIIFPSKITPSGAAATTPKPTTPTPPTSTKTKASTPSRTATPPAAAPKTLQTKTTIDLEAGDKITLQEEGRQFPLKAGATAEVERRVTQDTTPAGAKTRGVSSRWNIIGFGETTITIDGNKVTGTYDEGKGHLEGTTQRNGSIQFTWWKTDKPEQKYGDADKSHRGRGTLTIQRDRITGGYSSEELSGIGTVLQGERIKQQ